MASIDELAQRFQIQQGAMQPVNPAAFSGQTDQRAPAAQPQAGQSLNPSSQESMQEYLINKVMELKQRLGRGDVGALEGFLGGMRKRNFTPTEQYQQPAPESFMTPRDQSGNEIKVDPREMIQQLRR